VNAAQLTAALHALIPLTKAMGVSVALLADQELVLTAPLAGNHNHAGSAFAGSLSSLASVAGWAFLHQLLAREQLDAELLLADARIRYRRPLRDELRARLVATQPDQQRFLSALRRGDQGRLRLTVHLPDRGQPAATFAGLYVALPR
jgi:thioesterase domain-containing protein